MTLETWYVRDADGAVRGPMSVEAYCEELRAGSREERNRIGDDTVGDARVSTVFLNLDHSHHLGGPPILFETMIFGGHWDHWQWRYSGEKEARSSHAAIVAALRAGTDPNEADPS